MKLLSKVTGYEKSIIRLLIGNGGAQLVAIIFLPLLTRVYTTSDFGVFGAFMAATTILAVLVTGRYEAAIPIPEPDDVAWTLLRIAFLLGALASVLITLFLLVWVPPFIRLLEACVFLVPLQIMLMLGVTTTEYWLNRKGLFGWVAKFRFMGSVVMVVVQSILSKFAPETNGLIVGFVLGTATTFTANIWKSYNIKPFTKVKIWDVAKTFINFPRFILAANLFNTAANQVPTMVMGNYFGTQTAGWYTLGNRALAAVDLISTAIGQVFYPEAARQYNSHGECIKLYRKTVKYLSVLALIIFPALFFTLPTLFELILGKEWRGAGELTRWMLPMFLMRMIFSPVSGMFNIAMRQHLYLYRQVLLIFMVILSMFAGVKMKDVSLTVGFYSTVYIVAYLIDAYISYNLAKGSQLKEDCGV